MRHPFHVVYPLVFLTVLLVSPVLSQQDPWKNFSGPYKGVVTSLAVGDHGLVFARTNVGVFRSTNNGDTWKFLQIHFDDVIFPAIRTLTLARNGFVFVVTKDSAVYRSEDQGNTWVSLRSVLSYTPVKKLVFSVSGDIFALVDSTGIMRSTDHGNSWKRMDHQLPISHIHAFAVNSTKTMLLTADTNLYRSTDDGSQWTVINKGLVNKPTLFAVNSRGHFYGGASGAVGIYRSTNSGDSWSICRQIKMKHPSSSDSVVRPCDVRALAINSRDYIFAVQDNKFIRSTDDGNSWTEISANVKSRFMVRIIDFAINANDEIYAGTINQGIIRSSDHGDTWTTLSSSFATVKVGALAINSHEQIFVGTDSGVVRSTDNGSTWIHNYEGMPSYAPVRTLALNSRGDIFAGIDLYDIYRSTNNGDNWVPLGMQGVYFGINSRDEIYSGAGIEFPRAYRSINNGDVWERVDGGLILNLLSFAFDSSGRVFAGSSNGVIFRSSSDSIHWTELKKDLPSYYETRYISKVLAINSLGYIFAATEGGLYRSTNSGDNWENVDHNLPSSIQHIEGWERPVYYGFTQIRSLVINALGTIYVGYDRGIYFSTDNGETWNQFNHGMPPDLGVTTLALDHEGYLYVGTNHGTVLRSEKTTLSD